MIDTNFDVFDSIKDQLSSGSTRTFDGPAPWTRKLSMNCGKTYLLRLLPYTKEGAEGMKKTIFTYTQYIFSDVETHRMQYIQSPATFGQPCPFDKYRNAYRANHTEEEFKAFGNKLRRSVGRYINALLIDTNDDTRPKKEGAKSPKERIGEVVAINIPNSLWNVIQSGLKGEYNDKLTDEAREFNPNAPEVRLQRDMFDLNPTGLNLRVEVKLNPAMGGYNDYSSSQFTFTKRDLKKSDDELKALLDDCIDLSKMNRSYTYEECETILRKGFLGEGVEQTTSQTVEEFTATVPSVNTGATTGPISTIKADPVDTAKSQANDMEAFLNEIDSFDIN